jgi:phage/plasmid-like protein (TIGR03299 family)
MPAYFEYGFSVREPAWHGLATVLDHYPGREEAMRLAGHDFTVLESEIAVPVDFAGDRAWQQVPGWKALINDKDGSVLNVVRNSYQVVQNDVLWDIVDVLVGQPNVKYETAGILKGGAVLWVLAYLDEPVQIPGDNTVILPFIMASTTHDGSGSCRAEATDIRVVCWNTYSASQARSNRLDTAFTFRHTARVMERIEDAKAAIRGVRKQHEEFVALAEELAQIALSEAQIQTFLENMIPMPQVTEGLMITDRVANNIHEARQAVKAILYGPTIPDAHRNTGYGVWQAAIEYLDHVRKTKGDANVSKFNRSIMRQEPVKSKLHKLIKEVALV